MGPGLLREGAGQRGYGMHKVCDGRERQCFGGRWLVQLCLIGLAGA